MYSRTAPKVIVVSRPITDMTVWHWFVLTQCILDSVLKKSGLLQCYMYICCCLLAALETTPCPSYVTVISSARQCWWLVSKVFSARQSPVWVSCDACVAVGVTFSCGKNRASGLKKLFCSPNIQCLKNIIYISPRNFVIIRVSISKLLCGQSWNFKYLCGLSWKWQEFLPAVVQRWSLTICSERLKTIAHTRTLFHLAKHLWRKLQ